MPTYPVLVVFADDGEERFEEAQLTNGGLLAFKTSGGEEEWRWFPPQELRMVIREKD